MNIVDTAIMLYLNSFAQRSQAFDQVMLFAATSNLLKGGVMVMLLWWLWFARQPDPSRTHQILLATLAASVVAVVVARAFAFVLPFRARPLYTPELHWQLPTGLQSVRMEAWSSFPSDHAALFFALAMGLFLSARPIGVVGLLDAVCVVSLPRVYLGLHYPTDILGGALIGIVLTWAFSRPPVRAVIARVPLAWKDRHPSSFYAAFFLFSYEIVTVFEATTSILRLFSKL